MRIYVDESGTHASNWLVIGMLFVPDHHLLHPDLCRIKDDKSYLNHDVRKRARYKESHFAEFKSPHDGAVAKAWVDRFLSSQSVFRAIVVDWSVYQGKYFGDPFEPDALKKRRAYKKWAEMLLQPEVASLRDADLYLDRLLICYGYDVLDHLGDRFTKNYQGTRPRIRSFQPVRSWKDAHQCLQLCDILVGTIAQKLTPSTNPVKLEVMNYVYEALKPYGVKDKAVGYWKQYADAQMSNHFPKFSEWYWRPKK